MTVPKNIEPSKPLRLAMFSESFPGSQCGGKVAFLSSYFSSNSPADLMGQENGWRKRWVNITAENVGMTFPSGRIEQCNKKNRSLKNVDF